LLDYNKHSFAVEVYKPSTDTDSKLKDGTDRLVVAESKHPVTAIDQQLYVLTAP